jgi:hypothetical protein
MENRIRPKSAHLAQPPARPCPRLRAPSAWQAGPACRRNPEHPLSPSLYVPWTNPVSAIVLGRALSLPLSVPPSPPVSRPQPPAHDLPAVDAPTTARPPATTEPPRPARPPPLSYLRPLPSSLTLSLALPTWTESFATARRRPPPVPWPPLRPCPIQCHGKLHLAVSYSGHPLVCPPPLWSVWSALIGVVLAQPELCHRRPVTSVCLRRCPVPPALPLKVSNLPAPLFPCVLHWLTRNCSPELPRAAISPPRRMQRPLVLLRRRGTLGWVRHIPCARLGQPQASGTPSWPVCSSPVSSRRGTERRHRAHVRPLPLDLGRSPEIGQCRANPSGSNRSRPIQIQLSLLSPPHPRLCPWARLVSPPWLADALAPLISRVRAPTRSNLGRRFLIWWLRLPRTVVLLKNPLVLGNQLVVLCFSA